MLDTVSYNSSIVDQIAKEWDTTNDNISHQPLLKHGGIGLNALFGVIDIEKTLALTMKMAYNSHTDVSKLVNSLYATSEERNNFNKKIREIIDRQISLAANLDDQLSKLQNYFDEKNNAPCTLPPYTIFTKVTTIIGATTYVNDMLQYQLNNSELVTFYQPIRRDVFALSQLRYNNNNNNNKK